MPQEGLVQNKVVIRTGEWEKKTVLHVVDFGWNYCHVAPAIHDLVLYQVLLTIRQVRSVNLLLCVVCMLWVWAWVLRTACVAFGWTMFCWLAASKLMFMLGNNARSPSCQSFMLNTSFCCKGNIQRTNIIFAVRYSSNSRESTSKNISIDHCIICMLLSSLYFKPSDK